MGDSSDDVQITDADFAAADELWANEKFPSEEKRDAFRRFSAYLHAKWGDHKFRVRYGLKPPSTRLEVIEAEYYQGRITKEQYREKYYAYVTRPADQEMLDCLLQGIEKRLNQYARFMQAIVDLVHDLPQASLDRANASNRHSHGFGSLVAKKFTNPFLGKEISCVVS
jgi:hypothetical protein